MEDVGDDFGDLYADVQIQASSVINGAPDFVKFYEDDTDNVEGFASGSGSKELDFGDAGSSRKSENDEPNVVVVDNGSDSEDDFNIVLNDEDGQRFPVRSGVGVIGGSDGEDGDGMEQGFAGGERGNGAKGVYHSQFSQYKYIRSHSTVFPSNAKANGTAKVASFPSVLARGDWEENGSNQHMGSSSGEVASTHAIAAPLVAQGGYGFSLPWYRTILDVNIDAFEQKPWRHPGVDLTDFFNFGFNEETWKNYCNSLEQYRKQMYMLNRTPVYHSSKPNQTAEGGLEHEKDGQKPVYEQGRIVSPASKCTDRLELPKGRAIQVEGSTGERQPSMDVRRPRHRDSDVVIHIAVQDSMDDEIDHMDGTEGESSENADFKVGDNKDIHCFGGDDGNKPCLERNVTLDRSSVGKRSSKLSTASNPVSVDSDNVGNGKIPDVDKHCSQNMNVHVPEEISEVVDALNNRKERVGRNICNIDPCIMETELSLDELVSHSPSSSCHGSHSEASQDGGYIDPEKNQNIRRKPSLNLLANRPESITSEYYLHENSKNKGGKTKSGDDKDSSRNRSPIQEAQKNHDSRLCSVDELPSHSGNDVSSPMSKTVESLYDRDHSSIGHGRQKKRLHDFGSHDDDVSPMSNSEGLYYKDRLSVGFRRRKKRLCGLGSHDNDFSPMSEAEGMHCRAHSSVVHQGRKERLCDFGSYDNDIFPMSETEGLSDKGHSFASHRRRKEQLRDFDSYDREGFSYYRETEPSFDYCSAKFADKHVQTAYAEQPHRQDHRSFRDEMHPHFRNKYFFEKRITRAGNKMMERDWHHRERNLSIEDMDPLTHRESRQLVLKYYYSDKERDRRWRKKNDKLQFQEGPHNDDDLFQCKHTDDFAQEKSTRSVPFIYKERSSLDEKYERHMPSTGRKINLYGRRKRYEDSQLDLDRSWSIGVEDEYGRHADHQSLSSWSYREPHTADGRNDTNDSRLAERHGRDRRQICPQGYRESDWFGNHNDAYNTEDSIIDPDDQFHIGRRRSRRQYEALHWTENELISSHLDENLYKDKASLSYERVSRHTSIHTKYRSAHVGMLIHDKKSQHQRYKRMFINRSSNVLGQGNHDQTVPRSRASVDLVVGEGKSSGRCAEARSAVRHDRFENMDWSIDEEQVTFKDVNGPQRGKTIQPDLESESNQNNEKYLDQFLVTEHDEALDIEEGQIIPEEMNKDDPVETKCASESTAPTRNVKRRLGNANRNKVVAEYDNQRILQTLAKMEKRQERFKEPITLKMEPDKIPKPQADLVVETAETMQQRPARKRRWNGS